MFAGTSRRALLAGAGAVLAVVLTACGGDGGAAGQPEGAEFNDTDVTFAQNMIPHHEQAIDMAELAETRASDPEIKSLAGQIKDAQDPEIATLRGWLKEWGEPEMPEGGGHAAHGGMDGMMTDEDMRHLEGMEGADFDRMFAEMMIKHHEGAITMAETEIADGANPDAIDMAKEIKRTQSDEVKTLKDLLNRL